MIWFIWVKGGFEPPTSSSSSRAPSPSCCSGALHFRSFAHRQSDPFLATRSTCETLHTRVPPLATGLMLACAPPKAFSLCFSATPCLPSCEREGWGARERITPRSVLRSTEGETRRSTISLLRLFFPMSVRRKNIPAGSTSKPYTHPREKRINEAKDSKSVFFMFQFPPCFHPAFPFLEEQRWTGLAAWS